MFLNVCCLENIKSFLSNLVSKIWFVRFIEVKFHLGAKFSIRFTHVPSLECRCTERKFKDLTRKRQGPNILSISSMYALNRFTIILNRSFGISLNKRNVLRYFLMKEESSVFCHILISFFNSFIIYTFFTETSWLLKEEFSTSLGLCI